MQVPAPDRRLEEIRREVAKDDTLAIVSQYVRPDDKRKVHGPVKGALYRIQILCRRYTVWSYPPGLKGHCIEFGVV